MVSAGPGPVAFCAGEVAGNVETRLRLEFGWLGSVPGPVCDRSLFIPLISLAQSQAAVAVTQPSDRDPHFHWSHSRGLAGGVSPRLVLPVCRPVCDLHCYKRVEYPVAKPGGSELSDRT